MGHHLWVVTLLTEPWMALGFHPGAQVEPAPQISEPWVWPSFLTLLACWSPSPWTAAKPMDCWALLYPQKHLPGSSPEPCLQPTGARAACQVAMTQALLKCSLQRCDLQGKGTQATALPFFGCGCGEHGGPRPPSHLPRPHCKDVKPLECSVHQLLGRVSDGPSYGCLCGQKLNPNHSAK